MKKLFYGILLAICTQSIYAYAEIPSVEQITATREIIRVCLDKYMAALASRPLLEKRIVMRRSKKVWKKIDLDVFDLHIGEFSRFISSDRSVMNAATGKDMHDLAIAYSSNCSRFAEGVQKFVQFSLGKPVAKDYTRYFNRERQKALTDLEEEAKQTRKQQ